MCRGIGGRCVQGDCEKKCVGAPGREAALSSIPRTPTGKFSKIHSAVLGYLGIGYVGPTWGKKLRKPDSIRGMGGIGPIPRYSMSDVTRVDCISEFWDL